MYIYIFFLMIFRFIYCLFIHLNRKYIIVSDKKANTSKIDKGRQNILNQDNDHT